MVQQGKFLAPGESPIDTHAHVVPLTLVDEARKSGKRLGVWVEDTAQGPALQFDGLPPLRPLSGALAKVEPRLQWMDQQGIGIQFLAPWLDIQGYTLAAQNAARWSRLFNEHLAQAIATYPHRFRGLATVPVQDGTLAAKEMEYAVKELGLLGVMLATDPVGQDLAREGFEPFWAAADQLGVPVVLHPPSHGFGANVKPGYLAYSLGRTLDTTITASKLILEGLFDRYPGFKMVLVHGGGYLPYQMSRIDQGYARGPRSKELQRGNPSAYLPFLYYDTAVMSAPAIRLLRDVAGADHIMLGSDFVFSGEEEPITEQVSRAGVSPEEAACIYCRTAQQLFLAGVL